MNGDVFIPLGRGHVAVIDFDDHEKIRGMKWRAIKLRHGLYAACVRNKRYLLLHRFLLDAARGQFIDHEDGDGLNNRRRNIRFCTRHQNGRGFRRKQPGASSQFIGVSLFLAAAPGAKPWTAQIQIDGKKKHLGYFYTEQEAALAFNVAALALDPNFIHLNKICV